jgi:hypothetical protein
VTETVQTLADGTHITQTMPPVRVYRDSLGRTREERAIFEGSPVIVEITDPVAQARYTLNTGEKVAHRRALSGRTFAAASSGVTHVESAARATEVRVPETVIEKLEPRYGEYTHKPTVSAGASRTRVCFNRLRSIRSSTGEPIAPAQLTLVDRIRRRRRIREEG